MTANPDEHLEELLGEDPLAILGRESSTYDREAGGLDEVVLFGVGVLGRQTLAGLRKLGVQPLAFCDNDARRWNTEVDGLMVLSPAEAAQRFGRRAVFVLTIWRDAGGHPLEQITRQMLAIGEVKVVSVAVLFWKYPGTFLPYFCLDLPHKTLARSEEVRKCLGLWADDRSRREFVAQIRWRLWMDFQGLSPRVPWKPYLPDELFRLAGNEVVVDCGAFDGDTLRDFLSERGTDFKHYFAIEPDPVNFEKIARFLDSRDPGIRDKITPLCLALSSGSGTLRFDASGTAQSSLSASGGVAVRASGIDGLFERSPPTYIKMDIEGAEEEALRGAENTIRNAAPVLAISVYHRFDDLWKLPVLIHSFSESYRFHLRPQADAFWDLVCYAVPHHRSLD